MTGVLVLKYEKRRQSDRGRLRRPSKVEERECVLWRTLYVCVWANQLQIISFYSYFITFCVVGVVVLSCAYIRIQFSYTANAIHVFRIIIIDSVTFQSFIRSLLCVQLMSSPFFGGFLLCTSTVSTSILRTNLSLLLDHSSDGHIIVSEWTESKCG